MNSLIKLSQSIITKFTPPDTSQYLSGLKKFNIFIGANNSGKSRFLRNMFVEYNKLGIFDTADKNNSSLQSIKNQIQQILTTPINASDTYNLKLKNYDFLDNTIKNPQLSDDKYFLILLNFANFFAKINRDDFNITNKSDVSQFDGVISRYKKASDGLLSLFRDIPLQSYPYSKLYIPILRGLRPLLDNSDLYLKREKKDHFNNIKEIENHIYTGSTIYDDVSKLKLGDDDDIKIISDFESFLEKNIINEKINLIPRYKDDVLYIKIGDNVQYPIYNLGDGLQSLITILFPLHIRRKDELAVFIEEPESHLHPEWQLLLLNCLKEFEKHQFFIATHSSIFMNYENVSVYTFTKDDKRIAIKESNLESEKVKIINQLGYKPSDLLQTNYVLWVEGESDRVYLKYWLHKFAPKLVDGQHFSLMFYGGDNYRHFLQGEEDFSLALIKNINQNFGIIFDSDRKNRAEHFNTEKKTIIELFKQNNCYGWLTKKKEIENYIPLDVFIESVEKVHKKEDIAIDKGDFIDRCTIIDPNSVDSYKPNIKLPDNIFKVIQKNSNGRTKGIDAKTLRNGIEEGLRETKKNIFNINKIKVSREIVKQEPNILDNELKQQLSRLISKIHKANNL